MIITSTKSVLLGAGAAAALLSALGCAEAGTTTIDFTLMTIGDSVASGPGVTLSLYGAPISSGAPSIVGVEGFFVELANTPDGSSSSSGIAFAFSAPVENVSFTFINNGTNGSFWSADNGATGAIGGASYCCALTPVVVTGGPLTSLKIDNGEGGADAWQFGVGQITYTTATAPVPEPASWAMMGLGFAALGFAARRLRRPTPALA